MTLRVLVVEDEGLVAMMLEDMLADLGHEASLAGDLEEAYRRLATEDFDLGILDINLGGARSDNLAYDLMNRGIPVILATGYGSTGLERSLKSALLEKPFDKAALRRAIAETLDGSGAE